MNDLEDRTCWNMCNCVTTTCCLLDNFPPLCLMSVALAGLSDHCKCFEQIVSERQATYEATPPAELGSCRLHRGYRPFNDRPSLHISRSPRCLIVSIFTTTIHLQITIAWGCVLFELIGDGINNTRHSHLSSLRAESAVQLFAMRCHYCTIEAGEIV